MVYFPTPRVFVDIDVHDGRQFYLRVAQVHLWHAEVCVVQYSALSVQIALELPSMTVLTKCDLVDEPDKIT